ncbi:MAG: hypothetical protein BroJett030_06480 [Alphaproteobacteria bacterium]|nr:MAG: hypothetical protein BroJett030_06480 [Alphaproteobacteria bacterium]
MSWFTGFAVYFLIWWLTLFLVLPHGVKSQAEANDVTPGTEPGAPVRSRIGLRLAINTVLAAVVFAVWYWVTHVLGIGPDTIGSIFPQDR